MPAVKKFTIRPLKFDDKLVEDVAKRRTEGESISTIAKSLKLGAGKVAMAELIAQTERVQVDDAAKLARAIVKERKAGKSWGHLAARYQITEGTARAAFEAASGQPFTTLDYRRRNGSAPAAKPARKTTKRVQAQQEG